MGVKGEIDLTAGQRRIVLELIERHLPDTDVWAYGSRVVWTSRPESDLDLVVFSGPEQSGQVSELRQAFEESDLPFRVDVLVWEELPTPFREGIDEEHVDLLAPLAKVPHKGRICTRRLAEVVDIVMGQSPDGSTVSLGASSGVPLLNGPREFGLHHPVPVQYTTDPKKLASPGDLLFCVRGSTGRMNWADQEYAIGRGLAAIRHLHDQDRQPFVRALVDYTLPQLLRQATGSVFSSVSRAQLSNIKCPVFSDHEQKRIANVLGILEDRICLNRCANANMQCIAEAIYKDWFIDYGPVRAMLSGRPAYLPANIWRLFPETLVTRNNVQRPARWRMASVGDSLDIVMGQSPPSSTLNARGDGLPFHQGSRGFGFRYPTKSTRFCTRPRTTADYQDTIIGLRAPAGDINMAWDKCCIGRGLAAIRGTKSMSASFTYYSLKAKQSEFRQYNDDGTVFGAITRHHFHDILVPQPPLELIKAFDQYVRPLDASIRSRTAQSLLLHDVQRLLSYYLIDRKYRSPNSTLPRNATDP